MNRHITHGRPPAAAPASPAAQTEQKEKPSMWERQLRAIVRHWNEFGPSHGFGEQMDCADTAIRAADGEQKEKGQ